ncbi:MULTISPECIES: hypothetical protein [Alkalihalophilus]|uniref:Uncharacterized protein n=1 Tax=Alkalihalophilus pseudofirmus (strain ATCC BAA-2126 / JCM 17055 / OF4) TaxID=398511 RepID=D3G1J6_ALKPO|nr:MULTISPECIES: hypothetical protein [Alkalihalophilus]ADC52222.1 hypothetical protein BpOF4_21134 [Alkalihalophilus pseudofirmus OF4]MEC2074368.1 hypothetical protein [Alkalihalophilus marmarensis]
MTSLTKVIVFAVTVAMVIASVTATLHIYQTLNQGYEQVQSLSTSREVIQTLEIPEERLFQADEVLFYLYQNHQSPYFIRVNNTDYPSTFKIADINVNSILSEPYYMRTIHYDSTGIIHMIEFKGGVDNA